MANLKIINASHMRIFTRCEHCNFIMKTSADSLYYLVECPKCQKDFICRKYTKPDRPTEINSKNLPALNKVDDFEKIEKLSNQASAIIILSAMIFIPYQIGRTNDISPLFYTTIIIINTLAIKALLSFLKKIIKNQNIIISKIEK